LKGGIFLPFLVLRRAGKKKPTKGPVDAKSSPRAELPFTGSRGEISQIQNGEYHRGSQLTAEVETLPAPGVPGRGKALSGGKKRTTGENTFSGTEASEKKTRNRH